MSDYPLLDYGIQSRNDNFHAVVEPTLSERRTAVLFAIRQAGAAGLTLDELSERFDVSPNAISGRITELKRMGFVSHTGERRRTRAGSTAAVIIACEVSP